MTSESGNHDSDFDDVSDQKEPISETEFEVIYEDGEMVVGLENISTVVHDKAILKCIGCVHDDAIKMEQLSAKDEERQN